MKQNNIVKFKKPFPDENPDSIYLLLDDPEVMRDGDDCRLCIRWLASGLTFAPVQTVQERDIELVPDYKGMTVMEGAEHVIRTMRKWSKDWQQWIAYANDPARGKYRGFAALHDKCDANMLLPFANDCVMTDEETAFYTAVMSVVTEMITRGDLVGSVLVA